MQINDWMVCWAIIQTLSSFNYMFGMGFSNATRTILNIKIGEGKNKEAKRSTWLSLAVIAAFGILVMILLNIFRAYIATVFTDRGTN